MKIDDIRAWLNQEPALAEVFPGPNGGKHMPIEILRPLLDVVHGETSNFVFQLYKQGHEGGVAASIELTIRYHTPELGQITRTSAGACNFLMKSIHPITDWNATAKSMAIKNAASFLAPRFGRNLNVEVLPSALPEEPLINDRVFAKLPPDIRILKMYEEAIRAGDEPTIKNLLESYDLSIENNNR